MVWTLQQYRVDLTGAVFGQCKCGYMPRPSMRPALLAEVSSPPLLAALPATAAPADEDLHTLWYGFMPSIL